MVNTDCVSLEPFIDAFLLVVLDWRSVGGQAEKKSCGLNKYSWPSSCPYLNNWRMRTCWLKILSLMEELPFIHLNEEDFRLAIFEQLNGPIRYDPDRLASLRFNPLFI